MSDATASAPAQPAAAPADATPAADEEGLLDRGINAFWRIFSSVWLAVSLLVVIVTLAILGTILGIEDAEYAFYRQWFFVTPLLLLMVNITVCTLSRYPWRLSQAPFLIVHVGLLTIIFSFIVTEKLAIRNAQVILKEGESTGHLIHTRVTQIEIDAFELSGPVPRPGAGGHGSVPAGTRRLPSRVVRVGFDNLGRIEDRDGFERIGVTSRFALDGDLLLEIEKLYPNFRVRESYVNDPSKKTLNPAIQLQMATPFEESDVWLFARDPGRSRWDVGPGAFVHKIAESRDLIELTVDPEPIAFRYVYPGATRAAYGKLAVVVDGEAAELEVDAEGKSVEHAGFQVEATRFFADLRIGIDGSYASAGTIPNNPALRLSVRTPKGRRYETFVFADETAAMGHGGPHGSAPSHATQGLRLAERSYTVVTVPNPTGMVIGGEAEHWLVRSYPDEPTTARLLTVGESFELERGPGVKVTLARYVPKAVFSPIYESTDDEDDPDSVQIVVRHGDTEDRAWVQKAVPGAVPSSEFLIGRYRVLVRYTYARSELGFRVGLRDFRVRYYEGSDRPREYQSEVWVDDPVAGERLDATIAMNQTLNYGGYKFFQESFQQHGEGRIASVFAVNYDPGATVFYVGFVIMILGVSTIFWLKPTLRRIESRRQAARQAARAQAAAGALASEKEPRAEAPTDPTAAGETAASGTGAAGGDATERPGGEEASS